MRCLITGGSRGLGRQLALEFAQAGHAVAFCYRADREAAENTKLKLLQRGVDAAAVRCDVSSPEDVKEMFRLLRDRWNTMDVLVNNAGVTHDALLARQSVADWQRVVDVNLTGAFYCTREAAAWMTEHRRGHIINICSISALRGRTGQAAYTAAKAGLIGLTRAAAKELGQSGIRVNAVLPGLLATAMGRSIAADERRRQLSLSTLGRLGSSQEAARFVVHLAAMESVSGQVFNLDSRISH